MLRGLLLCVCVSKITRIPILLPAHGFHEKNGRFGVKRRPGQKRTNSLKVRIPKVLFSVRDYPLHRGKPITLDQSPQGSYVHFEMFANGSVLLCREIFCSQRVPILRDCLPDIMDFQIVPLFVRLAGNNLCQRQ